MKALTIRQPWASLIAVGVKTIENRSWGTKHRGPLAIHAAKQTSLADFVLAASLLGDDDMHDRKCGDHLSPCHRCLVVKGVRGMNVLLWRNTWLFPKAAVVGVVDLGDIVEGSDDRFAMPGKKHWRIATPRRLVTPVPAVGRLGLFSIDLPPTAEVLP